MKIKRIGFVWEAYPSEFNWRQLPTTEGVYMIVVRFERKSKIVYIGSTKCFRTRCVHHEVMTQAKKMYESAVKFLFYFYNTSSERFGRRSLEVGLLKKHKPELNYNIGYNRGKMARYKRIFSKNKALKKCIAYNIDR